MNEVLLTSPQKFLLSEVQDRPTAEGVSVVTCCMDRNATLAENLPSWQSLAVDEIIIVDWASKTPVRETLGAIEDSRIKIIRIEGERDWILTYAFNVGLRCCSFDKIYKLDADMRTAQDFLEKNRFQENQFIRGSWEAAKSAQQNDQVHVNGSFGCHKKHLVRIGFYHELIRTYGWDDSNLYERLSAQCGLETKLLAPDSLWHMPHEDSERLERQQVVKQPFLGTVPATKFNIVCNRYITRLMEYWDCSKLQDFQLEQVEDNCWRGQRMTQHRLVPGHVMWDAPSYAAMEILWNERPDILAGSPTPKEVAAFVYKSYTAEIPFPIVAQMLGVSDQSDTSLSMLGATVPDIDTFYQDARASETQAPAVLLAGSNRYEHFAFRKDGRDVHLISLPANFLKLVLGALEKKKNIQIPQQSVQTIKWEVFKQEHERHNQPAASTAPGTPPAGAEAAVRRKIYVDAQHGLCNRLRSIGSAASIAKHTGRELVIIWEPDHQAECVFADLFDYDGPVLDKAFIDKAAREGMDVYNYMTNEPGAEKNKPVLDSDKDIYFRSACIAASDHSVWRDENNFLKSLVPVQRVKELMQPFSLENHTAVHIRMEGGPGLDIHSYETADNWTPEEHATLQYWRSKSHYQHFIAHLDAKVAADPESRFFLATDLPTTYQLFAERYGDKLTYLERDLFDRSKEQILYALADVLLLSQCRSLVGSTWSSFSEMATRLCNGYDVIEMSGRDF